MADELRAAGADALVIGPGGRATAGLLARFLKLPFPVLADPLAESFAAFGYTTVLGVIRRSGTVVVDAQGTLRYVRRSANPQAAFLPAAVRAALQELAAG